MQGKPTGLLLLGCSDSNGCNRNLAGNDASSESSQKDDAANLQQLFLSSNGGWLKYNYERPGQTTTPPLLCCLSVKCHTNLLVNVAARLFSGLILVLIALMFLVCNAEHQILQRPARLRECVGE